MFLKHMHEMGFQFMISHLFRMGESCTTQGLTVQLPAVPWIFRLAWWKSSMLSNILWAWVSHWTGKSVLMCTDMCLKLGMLGH